MHLHNQDYDKHILKTAFEDSYSEDSHDLVAVHQWQTGSQLL
jgi:hypothetical protein